MNIPVYTIYHIIEPSLNCHITFIFISFFKLLKIISDVLSFLGHNKIVYIYIALTSGWSFFNIAAT